jgi:hypothetical protein
VAVIGLESLVPLRQVFVWVFRDENLHAPPLKPYLNVIGILMLAGMYLVATDRETLSHQFLAVLHPQIVRRCLPTAMASEAVEAEAYH